MKKTLFVIAAAAIAIVTATSPASSAPPLPEEGKALPELKPAYSRNLLRVGEAARIKLDENRTTGYLWHYEFTMGGVVEVVSDRYIVDPRYADRIGAGGTRHITLQAAKPGKTVIDLVRRRGNDVADTAAYHISVIPAYPELEPERTNKLAVGDYAMLVLYENSSVGDDHSYEITGAAVKATADEYISDPGEEDWTGVGYVRYIVFEAIEPGEAVIDLVYEYRGEVEWEKRYHITSSLP